MKAQTAKTMEIPEEEKRLEKQLCFAVYATAHAFTRAYKPILDRVGLTYPQYLVMLVLWDRADRAVGEIGERLLLESSTLTPLLKRLEAAGLVSRRRNPEDERQVRIALTDKGRGLRVEALAVPPAILAATGCDAALLGRLKAELAMVRDRMLAGGAEEGAAR